MTEGTTTVIARTVIVALAATAASLASLNACTTHHGRDSAPLPSTEHPTRTTGPKPAPPKPLTPAWRSGGFSPVSMVRVVDHTAVVFGTHGRQLYLYGLNPASGAMRWRHPASSAAVPNGFQMDVRVIGGRVTFFGVSGGSAVQSASLMQVDASSGRVVMKTKPAPWESRPEECGDGSGSVCLYEYVADPQGYLEPQPYRVDSRTGHASADHAPTNVDLDESGLFDLATAPERIGVRAGTRRLWSKPLAALFGSGLAAASRNSEILDGGTMYVATGLRDSTARSHVTNVAKDRLMAGSARRDGAVLWRQAGTSIDCSGNLRVTDRRGQAVPLRCRYTGTLRYVTHADGGQSPQVKGYSVALERFDPRTGKTLWRLPLGADLEFSPESFGATPLVSDHEARLYNRNHPDVIDLDTGAVRPASARDVFWCSDDITYVQSPHPDPGKPGPSKRYGSVTRSCDAKRGPARTAPLIVPSAVSADGGNWLRLVATRSGVLAYRTW